MQSNGEYNFIFSPNFNFGVDSVFSIKNSEEGGPFPPVSGNMLLLDNTPMLELDNTPMLLL